MGGPESLSLLFVYGSLRRGGSAHRLLDGAESLGEARYQGRLHQLGEYPAAVPSRSPGDRVEGELYRLPPGEVEACLGRLDRYEGPEYRRAHVCVKLADGGARECWIYLHRSPGEDP